VRETDVMETQKRGRRIAMSKAELDEFLNTSRTWRIATLTASGAPHVSPLWYGWDGASLWLYSLVRSQRWTDIERDPRVAVVIDGGNDYGELRGAELRGSLEPVGEAPRAGADVPEMFHDGKHAWLRLTPTKIASWDFRKIPSA
jgi:hypothetical protein